MKSLVVALLSAALLLGGCRSWNVNAFGYDIPASGERTPVVYGHHLQASDKYTTRSSGSGLSTEEKWGVVLILGVAIGAGVAVAATAN